MRSLVVPLLNVAIKDESIFVDSRFSIRRPSSDETERWKSNEYVKQILRGKLPDAFESAVEAKTLNEDDVIQSPARRSCPACSTLG